MRNSTTLKNIIYGMVMVTGMATVSPSFAEEQKTKAANSKYLDTSLLEQLISGNGNETEKKEPESAPKPYLDNLKIYLSDSFLDSNPKNLQLLKPAESEQLEIGGKIVSLLKDECDKVNFYFLNTPEGKDLVVRCYYEFGGNYISGWGANINNICTMDYEPFRKFIFQKKANLGIRLATGEYHSKEMSADAGKGIFELIQRYMVDHKQYYGNECRDILNHRKNH